MLRNLNTVFAGAEAVNDVQFSLCNSSLYQYFNWICILHKVSRMFLRSYRTGLGKSALWKHLFVFNLNSSTIDSTCVLNWRKSELSLQFKISLQFINTEWLSHIALWIVFRINLPLFKDITSDCDRFILTCRLAQ